jgi:hypothetical protein
VFCNDTALYLDVKCDHKDRAVTGETAKSLLNFGKIVTLSKHENQFATSTVSKEVTTNSSGAKFNFSSFRGSEEVQLTQIINELDDSDYEFVC